MCPRSLAPGVCQRLRWGGVEGLRVGRFNLGVNSSFVVYRIGDTWIDCGPPNQSEKVLKFASEGLPRNLLLTHHHEDHSGNAQLLKMRYGCRVWAPELARELLRTGFPIQFYRRAVLGVPPTVEAESLPAFFEDGQGYHWQAIPCPGHSDDMTCLYEANQGWLFSADLYVGSRVRYARPEDRLSLEIASIKRVLGLPFEHLFCSHRGLVSNGRQALANKYDYLISLREEVFELWQQGLTVTEIRRRLLGPEDHVSLLSGFHFCKENLVLACLHSALSMAHGDDRVNSTDKEQRDP